MVEKYLWSDDLISKMLTIEISAETKFHVQKYDGLENIEKRSPPLEVTLGSSTDTNLGHDHTKI